MIIPMVIIYKFCKRDILIQPPGEPREQDLGDVRTKKFELHKILEKTKWPEGLIYSGAFLKKMQKSKKWSHRNGKTPFLVKLSENIKKNLLFGVLLLQF